MFDFLVEALTGSQKWALISIPFTAAFVGWGTNWVAIKMTFYPLEFMGIPPWLGWQGIIPSKVEKMSSIVVDQTISKLGTLSEFFKEMEPELIAIHIEQYVRERIDTYTDEMMAERNPKLWNSLPKNFKEKIYATARHQLPDIVHGLVHDIGEHIEELVDIKGMIISQMSADKALMNRIFFEVGNTEFKFVINSGIWFGFIFGLIQMVLWIYYPLNWTLPAAGLFVGLATNWIALNFIFRPLNPIKFFGFTIHGLFLKRQKEVAIVFCRLVTREVLTLRHLIHAMMSGSRKDRTFLLIKKHLNPVIEGNSLKWMTQLALGPAGFAKLKLSIESKAISLSEELFNDVSFNNERAEVVARLFQGRMENLSSEEFQNLLRPAFQEDEWILIILGGALGMLAGIGQLFLVFGGVI
ncbi:MAG: hypothetical protein V4629_07435 [Pseudomonadota bacterium]